jgi:hypothetical protein
MRASRAPHRAEAATWNDQIRTAHPEIIQRVGKRAERIGVDTFTVPPTARAAAAPAAPAPGSLQPHSPHFSSTIHDHSARRINTIPALRQMKRERIEARCPQTRDIYGPGAVHR